MVVEQQICYFHRTTGPPFQSRVEARPEEERLSLYQSRLCQLRMYWKGSSNYASRAATRTPFSELTDTQQKISHCLRVLLFMCNMSRIDFPLNWEKTTYSSVLWEQSKLRPWSHCRNLVACLLELEVGRIVIILSLFHSCLSSTS